MQMRNDLSRTKARAIGVRPYKYIKTNEVLFDTGGATVCRAPCAMRFDGRVEYSPVGTCEHALVAEGARPSAFAPHRPEGPFEMAAFVCICLVLWTLFCGMGMTVNARGVARRGRIRGTSARGSGDKARFRRARAAF